MRVEIVDDTLRANRVQVVTNAYRLSYLRAHGRPLPDSVRFLTVRAHGRQVQDVVRTTHVFEGARLEHAVRRARRWIRGPRFRTAGAPHHIALYLAAFHKADPDGFNEAANATAA